MFTHTLLLKALSILLQVHSSGSDVTGGAALCWNATPSGPRLPGSSCVMQALPLWSLPCMLAPWGSRQHLEASHVPLCEGYYSDSYSTDEETKMWADEVLCPMWHKWGNVIKRSRFLLILVSTPGHWAKPALHGSCCPEISGPTINQVLGFASRLDLVWGPRPWPRVTRVLSQGQATLGQLLGKEELGGVSLPSLSPWLKWLKWPQPPPWETSFLKLRGNFPSVLPWGHCLALGAETLTRE